MAAILSEQAGDGDQREPVPGRSAEPRRRRRLGELRGRHARDVEALTSLLLDNTSIEVHGVGGGRGTGRKWAEASFAGEGRVESYEYDGGVLPGMIETTRLPWVE